MQLSVAAVGAATAAVLGGAVVYAWISDKMARMRAVDARLGPTVVTDTAYAIAAARASEAAHPHPLFSDPYARDLAGERGRLLTTKAAILGVRLDFLAVRTAIVDALVLASVAQVDTVLNLGAGLDARPWRLDLPSDLRWIDVDAASTLQYKEQVLGGRAAGPRCRYEALPADLAVRSERERVLAHAASGGLSSRGCLVITEGFLNYLTEEQVRELAEALKTRGLAKFWIADMAGAVVVQLADRLARLEDHRFQRKFFPADAAAYFAPLGLQAVQTKAVLDELARHRRMSWLESLLYNVLLLFRGTTSHVYDIVLLHAQ